jgi:hypothetical protein
MDRAPFENGVLDGLGRPLERDCGSAFRFRDPAGRLLCPIHAFQVHQMIAVIHHCDDDRPAIFFRFSSRGRGHAFCILQRQRSVPEHRNVSC